MDNFGISQVEGSVGKSREPECGRKQSNGVVLCLSLSCGVFGTMVGKSTKSFMEGNMIISSAILRGVSGAYLLQSGYGKLGLPVEAAEGMQGFAASGVPAMGKLDPDTFGKVVAYSELGIGAALLTPFVPNRLAGLGLGAFSAGLLSIYFRNPAMTQEDGIRPSEDGMALSKDLFLAGMAGALVFGPTKKRKKSKKK